MNRGRIGIDPISECILVHGRDKVIEQLLEEVERLREGIKDYLALHMPSRDELRELIE